MTNVYITEIVYVITVLFKIISPIIARPVGYFLRNSLHIFWICHIYDICSSLNFWPAGIFLPPPPQKNNNNKLNML